MSKRQYIGDSVYADNDGYSLILCTNNGYQDENTIYLEPEVVENLLAYLQVLHNVKITITKNNKEE